MQFTTMLLERPKGNQDRVRMQQNSLSQRDKS